MTNKGKAPKNEGRFLISKLYQKRLVESNRFVCYKADKKPYNAETKQLADITNKANYRSFDFACNSVKNTPDFEGIGFVLGDFDDICYCGLDIDYCIDEQGKIQPEALEIINLLNTYTEISRSGKGIHCNFIAKKQGEVCKNNNLDFCKCLELYDNGRYFALTGNIINNKDIEDRQEQCNIIYEKYFKCKEIASDNLTKPNIQQINEYPNNKKYGADYLKYIFEKDNKFKCIWFREITITDESATDQSFMNKLCYWLDEKADLMEIWFYKSPYFKGKDAEHKKKALRPDYISRTIAKAIAYRNARKSK